MTNIHSLTNLSHRSDTELWPLVRFVLLHFESNHCVDVHVTDQPLLAETTGLATIVGPKTLVTLKLASRKYPYRSRYVKELPSITVGSWQEEFVLVLAHELAHADQFYHDIYSEAEEHLSEVDAESQAYAVREHWLNFKKALTSLVGFSINNLKEAKNGQMDDYPRRTRRKSVAVSL